MSYGPGVNTAAVLLSSYSDVPSVRAANLIGMLLGMPVSAGSVDLASERLSARLQDAGFDDAMQAALGKEPVLALPMSEGMPSPVLVGRRDEVAGVVLPSPPVVAGAVPAR